MQMLWEYPVSYTHLRCPSEPFDCLCGKVDADCTEALRLFEKGCFLVPLVFLHRKYQDIEELSRTVVVELIRQIRVYDKKNIEITFDFDDCYQTLLSQLPAMGVDTVIDDDNNLQVKVKEVV